MYFDAIIFSTPTRFGNVASQMKQLIDTVGGIWIQAKTVNEVVSAMTSAQNPHDGQVRLFYRSIPAYITGAPL